jgi:hypothetical protein
MQTRYEASEASAGMDHDGHKEPIPEMSQFMVWWKMFSLVFPADERQNLYSCTNSAELLFI